MRDPRLFSGESFDKLRPGGVMALITSRYTMDKQDLTIRHHLAGEADLIGAIWLPNTTFKANAGAEITARPAERDRLPTLLCDSLP